MTVPFSTRHIGPRSDETKAMLASLGMPSLETLISQAVPKSIRLDRPLDLPEAASEAEALAGLQDYMRDNKVLKSFIGAGYHGCHVPPVIQRNLFENPAWYTAYTPYQSEISQGRLEMLFHFQTLVAELTGLPVASASLLDEASAAAEAVGIAWRHHKSRRNRLVVAGALDPQTRDVVATRAEPLGIGIARGSELDDDTFALIIPWGDTYGVYGDHAEIIREAKKRDVIVIFVADPLGLVLSRTPADLGAEIAVGSMQRFGVPMGFGGPHAAYCAVSDRLTRLMPGRLVGQSTDAHGRPGYRLALQTREQHIRRDKATSNICTAQALLANMAAAYAIWHGPEGLKAMAGHVHGLAVRLHAGFKAAGFELAGGRIFDTVTVTVPGKAEVIAAEAERTGRVLRVIDADRVGITFDETSTEADLEVIAGLFNVSVPTEAPALAPAAARGKHFLTQPVFHENRSETEMMRFLRRLADKDLALDRAMIPLGSCTMKLNAAAEMMPVSWPEVNGLHPFAPAAHTGGYRRMIAELEGWLSEITGFDAVSLQPNAGSQGEYAGLLAIRRYHRERGAAERDVCLIPSSAHGTNPASAAMAGMRVIVVRCTDHGDIDVEDLKAKAAEHSSRLAALMITYPSTHGVFEEGVRDMCALVHEHGGQVYLDGANLNALVGLARPGDLGADVCHMNLHKTFCIPHGGGGPGVGPIGVKEHLKPFLPGHVELGSAHAVAAAPFGSASILPITWMYIRMMGAAGLKRATEMAILNANYIAERLKAHYPVLYRGRNDRVAHECILDTRIFKERAGIGVEDIAKRLIDYGFHAPTMSWPVAGTLMVEPTESEPKGELDRFCDAMISIAREAERVEKGEWPKDDNPLVNAPHTAAELIADTWSHPYSRAEAAFPSGSMDWAAKYWPPVSRVDNVAGDRNLVCACPPMEALAS
ncbi:aminomethyl-transferring glycine dehydrogenase [Chelativorans sp. AA-79]|uniref:aminomethyl-transferring glycine dehydrogenase n=1 Tax=Chelativorans sp. AA-79 TaxID=3028735 RepID=UPI0023F759C4|nr:aminomethyl-transferring glycine dehydrogenase [Chelativorans sp. AA-79]WEX07569.1 aminomethyl-transferring glycine dehydrogenase [Chelativorans sp. AA-79]